MDLSGEGVETGPISSWRQYRQVWPVPRLDEYRESPRPRDGVWSGRPLARGAGDVGSEPSLSPARRKSPHLPRTQISYLWNVGFVLNIVEGLF